METITLETAYRVCEITGKVSQWIYHYRESMYGIGHVSRVYFRHTGARNSENFNVFSTDEVEEIKLDCINSIDDLKDFIRRFDEE